MAVVKRLSKVARELNVGISTIVDFLNQQGNEISSNPNTKIDENLIKNVKVFDLYEGQNIPEDKNQRTTWTFSQRAMLELTHNWGTETDKDFKHHNGNSKPQGFGHIGFSVPNVYEASNRFEKLGVKFVKKPDDGKMKGLAFIEDPDGYWIEILQADMIEKNS